MRFIRFNGLDTAYNDICLVSRIFLGFQAAARLPSVMDMAPKLAGLLHGITDTVYSCAGFIIPLISRLVDNAQHGEMFTIGCLPSRRKLKVLVTIF